jgi:hypothetical protein
MPIRKTLQAQEHRAKSSGIPPDQLPTNLLSHHSMKSVIVIEEITYALCTLHCYQRRMEYEVKRNQSQRRHTI